MPLDRQQVSTSLVLLTAILLGASLVNAPFPQFQYLQNSPTVVALLVLLIAARRKWLTLPSLICLLAFWWLHILGSRYTYSNVPYDAWSSDVFGTSLSSLFGWDRNHYDRLVHFAFGALFVLPIAEIARNRMPLAWALAFALAAVTTIGALYEIFEWLLTIVMSPEQAKSYNGQQGDMWDPQKDMALAGLGAILAVPVVVWSCAPRSDRNR